MAAADTDHISMHKLDNEERHEVESIKDDVSSIAEDREEIIEDIRDGVETTKDRKELLEDIESLKEDKNELHKEMASGSGEFIVDKDEIDLVKKEVDKAYAKQELKNEIKAEIAADVVEDAIENSAGHSKSLESVSNYGTGSYHNSETHLVHESKIELSHDSGPEKKFKSVVCAFIICLGSFSMGTVIGYPSPAIPNLNDGIGKPFYTDDEQTSWIGSIITLTALFGGLVGGTYMNVVGRQLGLIIMSLPMAIGWIIIVSSPSYGCMLAGRAVTGLIMGVISVICPVYLGEISPPSIRGVLGSLHQLLVCIGILYTYCFGYFLDWQWLVIAIMGFVILMAVALCFIVDSPRYLLSTNKVEECKKSIVWLRGETVNVEAELEDLRKVLESAKEQASFREFSSPHLWKPLAISIGLMIFQQFSGINVVMFYTVDIFNMAHIDMNPNVQTIVVGVVGIVGTLVSVAISDLVGRRILLVASGFLMAISMAGMGAFFYELDRNEAYAQSDLSWLPITCLVLFNFGFDVAYGPIPWLMMGELFPQRAKGLASSIATASNWLCAFIMTKFWTNMIDAMGAYGGYWLCCGFCVLSIFFIILFVPETKGKSLEEIEEHFKK